MEAKRVGTLLIVGLLVLSAMVVVIGTVSASPRPGPVNFKGTITDSYGTPVSANVQITGTVDDKTYTWSADTNSETGFFKTTQGHIFSPKAGIYVMVVSGESETRSLDDNDFTYQDGEYVYAWDMDPEPIPEFSTIALPVTMILGLLFFFNRRKHRKE